MCLPPLSLSAAQKNNVRGPRCLRLVLLFRRPHTACQDDSPLARTRLLACGRGLDDEWRQLATTFFRFQPFFFKVTLLVLVVQYYLCL